MTSVTTAKPLANIRILDFFWLIAGPLTSRTFANFGAEVIKVESAHRLDQIRETGVFPGEEANIDKNGVFNDCNTSKLSITLNVNRPKGRELCLELVKISDVVTNNFRPDRMDRWGLGYQDLIKMKPDIIMLTMPVMGTTGPLRNYGANGSVIPGAAGLNLLTGFPNRPPIGVGPLYSDFTSPYLAVTLILAALRHRNRTGRGQFIDLPQVPATVSLLGPAILDYTANGVVAGRAGNRRSDACPHGAFRCLGEDRWCVVAVETEEQWERLCKAIGRPEIAVDPCFATVEARKRHEDEVEATVEAWTAQRTDLEAMHLLQAAGVPAGIVETLQDMLENDRQLRERHFTSLSQPDGTVFMTHKDPIKLVGRPETVDRAPMMGEHNEYVFKELLGLSEDEIIELMAEGVIY